MGSFRAALMTGVGVVNRSTAYGVDISYNIA
jgi:hypothetical protein